MTGRPEDRHRDEFSGALGWVLAPMFLLGPRRASCLVAQVAEVGPDDSVLDLGCGVGQAVVVAARCGATALGVDPSLAMMRLAPWAARHEPLARFAHGTADRLPVGDGSQTVLWSVSAAHHWPDVPAGLAEARRVLRPEGRLGDRPPHRPRRRWLAVQGSR